MSEPFTREEALESAEAHALAASKLRSEAEELGGASGLLGLAAEHERTGLTMRAYADLVERVAAAEKRAEEAERHPECGHLFGEHACPDSFAAVCEERDDAQRQLTIASGTVRTHDSVARFWKKMAEAFGCDLESFREKVPDGDEVLSLLAFTIKVLDDAESQSAKRAADAIRFVVKTYGTGEEEIESLTSQLAAANQRAEEAERPLREISAIRDSIVGAQTVNWSEHIYPLVRILEAAGIKGKTYHEAEDDVGTLLDANASLRSKLAAAKEEIERLRGGSYAWLVELPHTVGGPSWWDGRGPLTFTRDPNDALRLSRREDAERAMNRLVSAARRFEGAIVTDHEWFVAPSPEGKEQG